MRLKNPRLVLQHRRLVDLVNHSARRPVQAVGPSVQSGSEDHHLPDTCVDGGTEVLVEEVGAHRLVVAGNPMHASAELITVEPGQIGVGQPCPAVPADDTNTLANSSRISGLVAAVSTARAAATPNAVAPTLSVIAQVSPAVRREDGNEDTSSSSVTACHAT